MSRMTLQEVNDLVAIREQASAGDGVDGLLARIKAAADEVQHALCLIAEKTRAAGVRDLVESGERHLIEVQRLAADREDIDYWQRRATQDA